MTNLIAWLWAIAGPLAMSVLTSLGIGYVTYKGIDLSLEFLILRAQNNWAVIPAEILQLASLSGIPEALSIVFAAYSARVSAFLISGASKFVLNK